MFLAWASGLPTGSPSTVEHCILAGQATSQCKSRRRTVRSPCPGRMEIARDLGVRDPKLGSARTLNSGVSGLRGRRLSIESRALQISVPVIPQQIQLFLVLGRVRDEF